MATNFKRILVHLRKNKSKETVRARFAECILEYFGAAGPIADLYARLIDNKLVLTNDLTGVTPVKIEHPPFCPVFHLSAEEEAKLPEDIANRGVDVGAAVILETGDGKVLLTRRAKHLRAFPGIWVPPGGHIEENESLEEAGLREFAEETGLRIETSQCEGGQLHILALWESVYPPKLSHGHPTRHHVVVYLLAKLKPEITSMKLQSQLKMQVEEVEAAAWLDEDILSAIVMTSENDHSIQHEEDFLQQTFSATVLNDKKEQVVKDLPLAPLLERSSNVEEKERVSTGTKFALEEWLKYKHH